MNRSIVLGYARVAAASLAAVGSILICIRQRHVHVVLSDPSTYSSPFVHRCGELMIGCLAWAAFEWMRQIVAPRRAA
jgi:hypothetical protein